VFNLERTSGWSLASHSESYVARAASREDLDRALEEARRRRLSVTLRGAGYSYGDEILNDGGAILNLSRMNRILDWNPDAGRMIVEPGVTIEQALACCIKDNWVVPAVPGTRHPTFGGALSNNIHGKNAWKDGNIGDWVPGFTLLAANGTEYRCSREENSELFYAAIGGLGMLGAFLEIEIQMKRILSPYLEVRKWTVPTLDRMLEEFEGLRESTDFHIGWVDCFPRGSNFGRGTIHAANFVESPKAQEKNKDFSYTSSYIFGCIPRTWVWPLIKPFFGNTLMNAVNTVKYRVDSLNLGANPYFANFFEFTFLLDTIPNWRVLFEPHGYLELEPLIPHEHCADAFRELIKLTQDYGHPSHLTAIKSHRKDDFLLGFSLDGCSIGIDIPVDPNRRADLKDLFFRMNQIVEGAGGKTYLAKDEMLTATHFRRMYPKWKEFDELKKKYDPELIYQSGMYRRLFLGSRASD